MSMRLQDELEQINCALSAGETSTTVDGTTTTIDLDSLQKRKLEIQRQIGYMRLRRPVLSSVNLSRAMG